MAGSHRDSAFLLERTHSIGSVAVACGMRACVLLHGAETTLSQPLA